MFKKAAIIPTGDELASGIIVDTDSPAVMAELLRLNGNAVILRAAPVTDSEEAIIGSIRAFAEDGCDLIVLIGGSGGGHRARHAALHPRVDCALYGRELTRPSVDAQQPGEFATRAHEILHRAQC